MGLLSAGQVTALESIKQTLDDEGGKIRGTLNSLFTADPKNAQHSAWRSLATTLAEVRKASLAAEEVLLKNEDAFGKG
jgi:hypothetical protein